MCLTGLKSDWFKGYANISIFGFLQFLYKIPHAHVQILPWLYTLYILVTLYPSIFWKNRLIFIFTLFLLWITCELRTLSRAVLSHLRRPKNLSPGRFFRIPTLLVERFLWTFNICSAGKCAVGKHCATTGVDCSALRLERVCFWHHHSDITPVWYLNHF